MTEMGTSRGGVRLAAALLAAIAAAAAAAPAAAGRLTDFSQTELHSLSDLCLSQRFISEELDKPISPDPDKTHEEWQSRLGQSFIHYHHYCWAVLYMHRAERAAAEGKFNYDRAVDNLNYVIRNSDPSFPLLPDVYFEKGQALERLGKREEAAVEYRNAVHARVDYVPAYDALAQYYLDLGDLAAASGVIAEGLKYDPSSLALSGKKAALAERQKAEH